MRGHDQILSARKAGIPVHKIEIEVRRSDPEYRWEWQRPGIEWRDGRTFGRIDIGPGDNLRSLDLRCCHGVPTVVFARSYDEGWPVADRVIEAEPSRATFCAPDAAVSWSPDEGVKAWDL